MKGQAKACPTVGVVIVTYNSADVIGACLDACSELDTVVVDNASTDETLVRVKSRSWALRLPPLQQTLLLLLL